MEDTKMEFVDLCVAVPSDDATTVYPGLEMVGSSVVGASTTVLTSPLMTPMEVTFASCSEDGVKVPKRRRKLDHLTPEEKSQYRKMMNRMSAQNARDRKKALIEHQDVTIKALQHSMESLKRQSHVLTSSNVNLQTENSGLKVEIVRLSQVVRELEVKLQQQQAASSLPFVIKQEVGVIEDGAKVTSMNSSDIGSQENSTKPPPTVAATLPLEEAQMLELAEIDFTAISSSPQAAPVVLVDAQQSMTKKGQMPCLDEADLYDSYWSPDENIKVDLFPELF